jgi:hypothetical protein
MREKQLVFGMAAVLIAVLMILSIASFDGTSTITGLLTASGGRDMTNLTTLYSVVPITRVQTGYELGEYDRIVFEAKTLVEKCRFLANLTETDICIATNLEAGWTKLGSEDTFYQFEVVSGQKARAYDEDQKKITEKDIIYKFALDFS